MKFLLNTSYNSFSVLLSQTAVVFLALAGGAYAQPGAAGSNFSDHALLERFPDSEIINLEFQEDVNYRIVLGGLQRTRGQVVADDSKRLRGDVTRITYEVSQQFTGEDVVQFFREQFQETELTTLFDCSGRACGSSNYWANDIFRNRILYGPERNQYYMAARTNTGAEVESYIALYIITRGNRKIYAYLEFFEIEGSPPVIETVGTADLLQTLRNSGSTVLPGISFTASDQLQEGVDMSQLVELLQDDPTINVYLVSHLQDSQTIETLMRRSLSRAQLLRQRLIDLGVDASRISAQGVGPLSPSCEGAACANRVEFVLR